MRKVFAWRVAGYITALLGFMLVGGQAALLAFSDTIPVLSVGILAAASIVFVMAALLLLLASTLLEGSYRASAHNHLAEVKDELADVKGELAEVQDEFAEVTRALDLLRDAIEGHCGDVASLSLLAESTANRVGAAERQINAQRNAERTLVRAQQAVDQRSKDVCGSPSNVHQLR